MNSWGSQEDLADELKKGLSLSRSSVRDKSELLEDDVVSLTSSDQEASALLGSTQEEQEMSEGEEAEAEPSQSSCPAYEELLDVMDRATTRLDLPWKRARKVAPRGRLDERYLSDHNPPALTLSRDEPILGNYTAACTDGGDVVGYDENDGQQLDSDHQKVWCCRTINRGKCTPRSNRSWGWTHTTQPTGLIGYANQHPPNGPLGLRVRVSLQDSRKYDTSAT
ncbi:hypothetical protein QQF64_011158 [Cirrhinus molitorella]|uniref:Uncharacterized protein n=1 Tax=Cirrhinus molitorella TaxID=172907 RepID=A0ABR3LYE3_9TELE